MFAVRAEPAGFIGVPWLIEYQLSRLTSPTSPISPTCQTQRASDQAAPSHMAGADKSGTKNTSLFTAVGEFSLGDYATGVSSGMMCKRSTGACQRVFPESISLKIPMAKVPFDF